MSEIKPGFVPPEIDQAKNPEPTNPNPEKKIPPEILQLIHKISRIMTKKMGFRVGVDDFFHIGVVAYLQAQKNNKIDNGFDPEQILLYVEKRVRGAMRDYVRTLDPLNKRERTWLNKLKRMEVKLAHKLQREPTDQELADALDITLEQIEKIRLFDRRVDSEADIPTNNDSIFDGVLVDKPEGGILARKELEKLLPQLEKKFTAQEKYIFANCFLNDSDQKDLAKELNITESRVSQIMASIKRKISEVKKTLDTEINAI